MRIENAFVFTETAQFVKKDIAIGGQYFVDSTIEDKVMDATDLYAIPGMVDTHIHGSHGIDVSSASGEDLRYLCRQLAKQGTTSFCPTAMSIDKTQVDSLCRLVAELDEEEDEASILGLHLEGPFLFPDKAGAHEIDNLMLPDLDLVKHWQELSDDNVRIITIAPELEGSQQLIEALSDDITFSVGHTNIDYDGCMSAFDAGASRVTHLLNAMTPFHHREPGVIGAAFDSEPVMVEIICDGVHLHPSAVRMTFGMFDDQNVILVSDKISAGSNVKNTLAGREITIDGDKATLPDGTIAGGTYSLYKCLVKAVNEMGIELESAVRAATMNAAQSVGMFDLYGSITPGKYADLLLVDEDLNLKHVIVRGTLVASY